MIRSSAAILLGDLPPGSDAARAGSFICEEVDRINAVVRALLDYARPLAPRRERLTLDALLTAVRPLVEETLRRQAMTLSAGASEAQIAGDPDLLAQLLLTLIENAAQASAPGRGRLGGLPGRRPPCRRSRRSATSWWSQEAHHVALALRSARGRQHERPRGRDHAVAHRRMRGSRGLDVDDLESCGPTGAGIGSSDPSRYRGVWIFYGIDPRMADPLRAQAMV